MPKVNINELDSSRYVLPSENSPMTVILPGLASFGPTFEATNPVVYTFNGETELPAFFNMYGYSPAQKGTASNNEGTLSGDLSFEYTTNLIRSGAQVSYYRLNYGTYATNTLSKTVDSETVTTTVSARYSGRFGNTLVVDVEKDAYDDNAAVLGIYSFPTEFSNTSGSISESDLLNQNVRRLYYSRVSLDETNEYFVGTNDNGFVTITPDNLKKILSNFIPSGETKFIFNLAGATDYNLAPNAGEASDDLNSLRGRLESSFNHFTDPYLFEFDIISNGGLIGITDTSASSEHSFTTMNAQMLNLAKVRGDCLAILDTPESFNYTQVLAYAGDSSINSSYGAIYAPWCSFVSTTTGRLQMMPPSIVFMKALLLGMQSEISPELWYVPAGVSRTQAPFIVDTDYEIGSAILDAFQNNNDFRVNPIMRLRNYGYCVYGNATCMRAIPGLPHSALESLNVRLISNVIKKAIFNICCGLSFEYNNSDLWLKFYTQMDEVLLYMKRNYGLYDYRIEMGASTVTTADLNERRVPGKVLISPNLAGEYFDIDFEIMPSGVSFVGEEE